MKNNYCRFLSFALALVMAIGLLVPTAAPVFAEVSDTEAVPKGEVGLELLDKVGFGGIVLEDFAGKKVSILGDSISTYQGISNNPSYNESISGNAIYYPNSVSIEVEETWWQQLIDVLDMELCVNNSWSGSVVFSGTGSAYSNRCVQLHNACNEDPDVILIYLGTNDYTNNYSRWGEAANIDYATLITDAGNGSYTYATPTTVTEAYAIILHKIQQRYPDALVYGMGMLTRSSVNVNLTNANNELKAVMEHFDVPYIELESLTDTSEEHNSLMANNLHPKEEGMDQITSRVIEVMFGEAQTLHDISYSLTNVQSNNAARMVLDGESYEATLTLDEGNSIMDISVTMGGTDITESCYADGVITIEEVTGEVVISAKGYDTLENALSEASSSLIVLHDDVTVSDLTLGSNLTLSLNGHTLNAKNVIVYKDNQIVDYTNGQGLLKVEENIALPQENSYLPVCDGNNGYIFVCAENYREVKNELTESNTAKFYFQPDMPDIVHDYLKDGKEVSGVELKINLSWKKGGTTGNIDLCYDNDLIEQFYKGYVDGKYAYAFTMTVTGTNIVEEGSLDFRPFYESCGVKYMLNP